MIEEIARKVINEAQQDVTYKLQDLLNEYSPMQKLFAIAAIKANVEALMANMPEEGRIIINDIVGKTEVMILPEFMDPRRHKE